MKLWNYDVTAGVLSIPNGVRISGCYSGNGVGLNNPAMESVHEIGPLPRGFYMFGTFFDDFDPVPSDGLDHKGPHVCQLLAVKSDGNGGWINIDPPYMRLGLMQHGDNGKGNFSASKGCLIAPRFARELTLTGDVVQVV